MEIVLIAHDIRSCHNIGSLARSCDGFGVKTIYCTGYTPYIKSSDDNRLPHVRKKTVADIHKTALGAEDYVDIVHSPNISELIVLLKDNGFTVAALEQSRSSIPLMSFCKTTKLVLILGTETIGLPDDVLALCDQILEIPMLGKKESFNVSIAGALAVYELKRSELY